jgi:molybdopterin converting factor small subunit
MTSAIPIVTVEFFGVPRERAGRAQLAIRARTVREALDAVELVCPGIRGLHGRSKLNSQYLLSLGGDRFITNLSEILPNGARLLILGADAGG